MTATSGSAGAGSEAVDGAVKEAVAQAGGWPEQPGVTGTVALVVSGGAQGVGPFVARLVDGRPVEIRVESPGQVDLTLTLTAADAGAVLDGSLAPSVAFMQGRLRTAGDNGLLLGVLAGTAGAGFATWRQAVASAAAGVS